MSTEQLKSAAKRFIEQGLNQKTWPSSTCISALM